MTSSRSISTISKSSLRRTHRNCRSNGEWQDLLYLRNETYMRRAGTVESRLRQLVMKLEFVESLTLAHPFIKGFDQVSYCLNEEEIRSVASGQISEAIARRTADDIIKVEGAKAVYTTTFYIGLLIEAKQRALSWC